MQLIVPFAAPLSQAGRAALAGLQLPGLQRLLAEWSEVQRDEGDEWTLSAPHERVLARALGWQGGNGQLPWAARAARADGLDTGDLAWGLVTPVHWHVGTDQVSLIDPAALMLDTASSRALFDAVSPLFTGLGYAMHWGAPLRWYAEHDSLGALPTASLDRVIGRNVDAWLGDSTPLRRLQSEVQMLLYNDPINAAREQRGLLPVNSFWLSGCGVAQASVLPEPSVDDRLRGPALADDWAAWVRAWETLDQTLTEAAPTLTRLTLCGERSAATFEPPRQRGALLRLRSWLHHRPPSPAALLETL